MSKKEPSNTRLLNAINKNSTAIKANSKDINVLKKNVGTLKEDVHTLKNDAYTLKQDTKHLKESVATINVKLLQHDRRFDLLEERTAYIPKLYDNVDELLVEIKENRRE